MPSPVYARFAHVCARRVVFARGDQRPAADAGPPPRQPRVGTSRPTRRPCPRREQPRIQTEFVLPVRILFSRQQP